MAKGLTESDLEKYRQELIARDLKYAKDIDTLQKTHFPKRLKNISEWGEAEKLKRLILGMTTDKAEHEVKLSFSFDAGKDGDN